MGGAVAGRPEITQARRGGAQLEQRLPRQLGQVRGIAMLGGEVVGHPLCLDQAAVGGPSGELVAGRELQLAQDGRHMGLDRLGRDAEVAPDLLVGVAPGNQAEDLTLAR